MEVILITPSPKYQTLLPSTKCIESTSVDMVSLIETQVFLNHHYNISFFCVKNNFPYQFHCPLKIGKHLLDRGEGAVELFISNGLYFKIEADTDTLEILSNVQSSLQGVESEHNVTFTLRFWEIQIRLHILNETLQESKIKQAISQIQTAALTSSTTGTGSKHPIQEISKIILYIDDNNYEEFLTWSENDNNLFDYQLNEKLSNEYMSLKQEIDNQKNSFRNKIKMVQAILGENINIDKLLNEEKQENQEYKRLRETFQTIKNIDNVLIEQERKLESRTNQFKDKRAEKHRVHYENAKTFAAKKNQIASIAKEIQILRYKVDCITSEKTSYLSKRNFEPNSKIKLLLAQQVNRCQAIVKNVTSFHKNEPKKQANHDDPVNKIKIIQSLHKTMKKEIVEYENLLKKRAAQSRKSQGGKGNGKEMEKITEEMAKYQGILRKIAKFYEKNNEIVVQIRQKLSTNIISHTSLSSSFVYNPTQTPKHSRSTNLSNFTPSPVPKIQWPQQQFFVLNELLKNNSQYQLYSLENKENSQLGSGRNKVGSNLSINQKFGSEEEKYRDKEKERNRGSVFRQSLTKIQPNKFVGAGANSVLTKTKIKKY